MRRPPKFDTPILILGWRRPHHILEVIAAVRHVSPVNMWLAIDGPVDSSQLEQVERTRTLAVEAIDWPCSLRVLFREGNLGCRLGVVGALDWFFSEVEEGIVLEDDCVPSVGGLVFFAKMLERYRTESAVLSVSGDNSLGVRFASRDSYFFSGFPHIWGWATWRRAWALYDREMHGWRAARLANSSSEIFPDDVSASFWSPLFDRVTYEPRVDTWDWQWTATHFLNKGLAVQPSVNLVRNIGFDELATHTRKRTSRSNARVRNIFPLRHPPLVSESVDARAATYRRLAAVTAVDLTPERGRSLIDRLQSWVWTRYRTWKKFR